MWLLADGARVTIMLPNVPQFTVVMAGVLRAGYACVNVNPLYAAREQDQVVERYPRVLECAAVGVADEMQGEAIKIFVVHNDPALTEDDVARHCHAQLTGRQAAKIHKVPRRAAQDQCGQDTAARIACPRLTTFLIANAAYHHCPTTRNHRI